MEEEITCLSEDEEEVADYWPSRQALTRSVYEPVPQTIHFLANHFFQVFTAKAFLNYYFFFTT